jgi:hypothetical protein
VILSWLRALFPWQDNYLRFSGAREAVEAELGRRALLQNVTHPDAEWRGRRQVLRRAASYDGIVPGQ